MKDATLLLTAREGWNDGSRAFYRGHLMVLKKNETFIENLFEKANPEQTLGFNTNSLMVVNNNIYTLSTQKHGDQAPLIHILDNKTLKIKKIISLPAIVEEGIPIHLERMHVVSEQKAYLFFYGSIFELNLQTGKLGKKLENVDEYTRIKYPFFEIGGKIYALAFDDVERKIISIDTTTNQVNYTPTGEEDDKEPVHIFREKDDLISINRGFYGKWNLSKIPLTTLKATKTIDIPIKMGTTATLLNGQPILFFNGKYDDENKTDDEKTIFKYNFETNKIETFAKLKTNRPKSTIYQMTLFVHPTSKELIAAVQDDVVSKFVRVYDTKVLKLPTNEKKEFLYNSKSTGVSEIVSNSIDHAK